MNLRKTTLYIFSLALACNAFASLSPQEAQTALDIDPASSFSVWASAAPYELRPHFQQFNKALRAAESVCRVHVF